MFPLVLRLSPSLSLPYYGVFFGHSLLIWRRKCIQSMLLFKCYLHVLLTSGLYLLFCCQLCVVGGVGEGNNTKCSMWRLFLVREIWCWEGWLGQFCSCVNPWRLRWDYATLKNLHQMKNSSGQLCFPPNCEVEWISILKACMFWKEKTIQGTIFNMKKALTEVWIVMTKNREHESIHPWPFFIRRIIYRHPLPQYTHLLKVIACAPITETEKVRKQLYCAVFWGRFLAVCEAPSCVWWWW